MTVTIADLAIFYPNVAEIKGADDYYHGNLYSMLMKEYTHERTVNCDLDYHDGFYIEFADGSGLRYRVGVDGPHGPGRLTVDNDNAREY